MSAGEIVGILHTRTACLPGSRDLEGRPLITVAVPQELQAWTKDNLDLTLCYFSSLFTSDTRRNGLTVVVDAQKSAWRVVRTFIRYIGLSLGPDLANLVVLRPDVFWDKQRVDNCTKTQKDGEAVYIPISRLHKFVDASQLTEELGGTWPYNHAQWIQNRLCIEAFTREAKSAQEQLEAFHLHLTHFTTGVRLSTANTSFVFSRHALDANKIAAQKVLQTGRQVVSQIEKTDQECQRNSPTQRVTPQDTIDTIDKLDKLLETIEHKQESIDTAWLEMEKKFVDTRELSILESGVGRVTKWILGTAEMLLNEQQQVGYDVPSSEELRTEHEALELQCRETYGQYAELLHKIDTLPQLQVKVSEDLKSQRDFMDFVCRSFATRLERRRNILITCLRFYRLVTEYFERTSDVFENLVMSTDVDSLESADCSLQELQESQTSIDFLAKELVKEGEKLSDMLSMPVKDALGRDIDVNYESDIVNVQEILHATLSRKQLFSGSVDLQKLTLEQVSHIHVYETDAGQAVQWLTDLFQVMLKEHIHVGSTVHEIQLMKEDHQAFQETAKGTFEYGCQLLSAALALRHSCKLPEEHNTQVTQSLWQVWKRLQTVGQEQMTRLRVSAVFHRSVKEHCKQLRELMMAVQTVCRVEDLAKRRARIRKFLQSRERLLLEVGRMVRLGRLLRTRLKEPVCPNQESTEDSNVTSVEAISDKLAEVTSLAEQLDVALCSAQADGLSLSAVSPNMKKILDGTVSTTPEEWYSNLKPGGKTPNTSSDSKSEDEFVTASECTCTPPSRSSSFHTASEGGDGGAISPWWDLDATSDSEEKSRPGVAGKRIASPARVRAEMLSEIVVREVSETTSLKMSSSGNLGVSSFLLENTSSLLRPDMTHALSERDETRNGPVPSSAHEIVRQLSQIVKNNETYTPTMGDEQAEEKQDVADNSSQYSCELMNPVGSQFTCERGSPTRSHTKSLSYETDNTDMSLPKFSTDMSTTSPEVPRFSSESSKARSAKFSYPRYSDDESAKIYIIDTSTPSPKSKRYMETSFDSLDLYQQPVRKVVEAEVHEPEVSRRNPSEEELAEQMMQVRKERRRPVTTIDLQGMQNMQGMQTVQNVQGACALPLSMQPPDCYYPHQITRLAIKGIF